MAWQYRHAVIESALRHVLNLVELRIMLLRSVLYFFFSNIFTVSGDDVLIFVSYNSSRAQLLKYIGHLF